MPVTAFNGNGLVSKLEILRGDLVDVLYQSTEDHTEYRFNTRIEDLSQNEGAVQATLSDGTTVSADLVVGCDGPHSAVRRLVFGPEERFVKPLGGYNAWFTAPDTVGLDGWYLMYQAPGLNASMRPSHDPAMCKAGLAFRSESVAYDRRSTDEQRALAISLVRREEVVHHRRCHRSADVRHVLRRWSSRGARACSTAPSLASAMR
jgi:2-polyprenyl-6-methoxyphenol hydroxylase-like FAD-dependent oxidoreductase